MCWARRAGAQTAPRDPSKSADKPVRLPVRTSCAVPLTSMLIFLPFSCLASVKHT